LFPLAYVIPGAASDTEYEVRLLALPEPPEAKAQVAVLLARASGGQPRPQSFQLPTSVQTFTVLRTAEVLADQFRSAGASAEVVTHRHWTSFYFRQALGFEFVRTSSFPLFRLEPNAPFLWECLRNSLLLAFLTTVVTTL